MEEKIYSFEEASARLEEVLKQLDRGDIPLEEAITAFQEGLELMKICKAALERAEGTLQQFKNGEFTEMGEMQTCK